jgi:hypothetical protein
MEQDLIKAGTEGFNLPHDVVTLPPGGIFYKSKKKTIKVGYLTANDENILIGAAQNANTNIILTLLRSKIYESELRPEELLNGDVEAIMIYLRNTSFGPEYEINLTDPKTGKLFTTTVILDELNIKQTNSKPDENGLFTTTLPKTNSTVKLKPLNYSEVLELGKLNEQYPSGRVAPTVTWRLNKQIQEVDGITDKGQISMFVESLPIMDSKFIRNFMRDNEPSLDLKKTTNAPSGELVSFEITFGVEFFRPFF